MVIVSRCCLDMTEFICTRMHAHAYTHLYTQYHAFSDKHYIVGLFVHCAREGIAVYHIPVLLNKHELELHVHVLRSDLAREELCL